MKNQIYLSFSEVQPLQRHTLHLQVREISPRVKGTIKNEPTKREGTEKAPPFEEAPLIIH
jgi:hypothetical protein